MSRAEERYSDDQFVTVLTTIFFCVLFFAAGVALSYWLAFKNQPISTDPAAWGQLGDYFGGLVNPVVGLVTVFFVLLSLSIQRKELRATVDEMKISNTSASRMSFEQTLFAWLNSYSRLLDGVGGPGNASGRQGLRKWHDDYLDADHLWDRWRAESDSDFASTTWSAARAFARITESPGAIEMQALDAIFGLSRQEFDKLVIQRGAELEPVFNTLSSLLQWIDSSTLTRQQKWDYVTIVRSQLSWPEKAFLMHFGMADHKLSSLINRYALLDELEFVSDFYNLIVQHFPVRLLGDNRPAPVMWDFKQRAFDAILAEAQFFDRKPAE